MNLAETKQLFTELTTEESAAVNGGEFADLSGVIYGYANYFWNLPYYWGSLYSLLLP